MGLRGRLDLARLLQRSWRLGWELGFGVTAARKGWDLVFLGAAGAAGLYMTLVKTGESWLNVLALGCREGGKGAEQWADSLR